MTINEKIAQAKAAIAKTKSPLAKRDLEKHLKRLENQRKAASK